MDPFPALADETRRRLLRAIAESPRTAGELADTEPVSRPAVSRHLKVLLDGGLVKVSNVGRTRVYSIEPRGWEPVRELERGILQPQPQPQPEAPFAPERFDALELEVRRAGRDRRAELGGADDVDTRNSLDDKETA